MQHTVDLPDNLDPKKVRAVLTMIETTMREDGEFALVRIPYSFPQQLIAPALIRLRVVMAELAAQYANTQGAEGE